MASVATPSIAALRFAERDLIRERFPFFAVVWIVTSFVWLFTLAAGATPLPGWQAALAIGAAELAVLLPAVRVIDRSRPPISVRVIALAASFLAVVWSIARAPRRRRSRC